jgi:class 3 adenylate cyclase
VAYKVTGAGDLDILFVPGFGVPIDLMWDDPGLARMRRRLGTFSRTIWMESGGWGASEGNPVESLQGDVFAAELDAVLDAEGIDRIALWGANVSGTNTIYFAAVRPERVSALVLLNTFSHYIRDEECPWGVSAEVLDRIVSITRSTWGTGANVDVLAPSRSGDDQFRQWWARCERLGAGPETAGDILWASLQVDRRPQLPLIEVPTLVLHAVGNRIIRVDAGRYLAERIGNARFVELPGADNIFFANDTDPLMDEVEEFLTGNRPAPEGDVVTTTVLFTDIVASTAQAARLGHRRWTALVDEHNAKVRATLARYRGREIKTIGDGFLAVFDATTRAVRATLEILDQAKGIGLDVRAGVHVGEVEVRVDDVVGLAVTVAKRICDLAPAGEVFASRPAADLTAGSGLTFTSRGDHRLKGIPGEWPIFAAQEVSTLPE